MTALGALLGGLFAAGLLLAVSGLRPVEVGRPAARRAGKPQVSARRLLLALGAALIVGVVTRWPVGVVGAAVAGWFVPNMAGGTRRSRRADTDKLRALAAWANQLRDGFAGVGMLQSTICDSEKTAPRAIRAEVQRLALRMRSPRAGSAEHALRMFAGELVDSTADMIVTALLLATNGSPGSLPEVLSALAEQADREVAARLEVESHRAEVLMARRIILVTVGAFTAYTVIFRQAYLRPFSTAVGQVAVAVVIVLFAGSAWYMDRLSRLEPAVRTMRPEEALDMAGVMS